MWTFSCITIFIQFYFRTAILFSIKVRNFLCYDTIVIFSETFRATLTSIMGFRNKSKTQLICAVSNKWDFALCIWSHSEPHRKNLMKVRVSKSYLHCALRCFIIFVFTFCNFVLGQRMKMSSYAKNYGNVVHCPKCHVS